MTFIFQEQPKNKQNKTNKQNDKETENSGELCEGGVVARLCLLTVEDHGDVGLFVHLSQDEDTQSNVQHLKQTEAQVVQYFVPQLHLYEYPQGGGINGILCTKKLNEQMG